MNKVAKVEQRRGKARDWSRSSSVLRAGVRAARKASAFREPYGRPRQGWPRSMACTGHRASCDWAWLLNAQCKS